MAPDIDYALTEDSFRNYECLLAEVGITAVPEGRTTVEDLKRNAVMMLTIHGRLHYAGRAFHYQVQQTHLVQRDRFGYSLNVWVFEHGFEPAEPLKTALERAFPFQHPAAVNAS